VGDYASERSERRVVEGVIGVRGARVRTGLRRN
jgi:hypothetical protein